MHADVKDDRYDEGYWERGEGSNYVGYADDAGWAPTAALLRTAMHATPHRPSLMEYGCAKGYFVKAALDAGFDAYGCDPSTWALEHPANDLVASRISLGNAQTYMSDRMDVVCSWEMLEHVDEHDVVPALQNMWAHVMKGGLMVHRICLPGAMHDVDATHVTMHERDWWEGVIERHLPTARRVPWLERGLDVTFDGRDWAGRFFAYRRI